MNGEDVRWRLPAPQDSPDLGRREFFGRVALVAGGIAVSTALPWPAASAGLAPGAALPPVEDWSIDDQWGTSPRYAEPIGFGRRREARLAAVGALEALFHL